MSLTSRLLKSFILFSFRCQSFVLLCHPIFCKHEDSTLPLKVTLIRTFPPQGGRRLRVLHAVAKSTSPEGKRVPPSSKGTLKVNKPGRSRSQRLHRGTASLTHKSHTTYNYSRKSKSVSSQKELKEQNRRSARQEGSPGETLERHLQSCALITERL